LPFDLNTPYITEINGQPLETYIDWLASNFMITMAGLPAISIPAGFAAPVEGAPALPVGLQLVGRWAEDLELLNVAEAIESVLAPMNHSRRLP
jgi:amidase